LIPFQYDPAAGCDRFVNKLLRPVLSPEDIELLQRYCGVILIGGNRAQKILLLLDQGGTGKGTLVNIITSKAYIDFCVAHHWPPVSERTFEDDSRYLILDIWNVKRSHDIERNAKSGRGYHRPALINRLEAPDSDDQ
jgi:hypothetical protein